MKGMLNMKESLDYSASVKHLVEYFKGEVVVKREIFTGILRSVFPPSSIVG